MLCEKCQVNKGTIEVARVHNGVRHEMLLCEQCLKEEEQYELETPFSANHFISSIIEAVQSSGLQVNYIKTTSCSKCGMTYGVFRELRRLGCDQCYMAFEDKMDEWIKAIHGHVQHVGKKPNINERFVELKTLLSHKRQELHEAIRLEHYEEAARIRDAMVELEEELERDDRL